MVLQAVLWANDHMYHIYIYESYIIQVFSLQNFEVLAAATSSASARRLPRLNLCQRVVNQLMFKH